MCVYKITTIKEKSHEFERGNRWEEKEEKDPIISLLNLIQNKINLRKRYKTLKERHCLSLRHRFPLAIAVFRHLH